MDSIYTLIYTVSQKTFHFVIGSNSVMPEPIVEIILLLQRI